MKDYRLLTVKEFAKEKGISRQAVEDRISRKTLPVVYITERKRVLRIPVPVK